jgi:large subunit ribosomal protein L6
MKKDLYNEIEIPEGVEATFGENVLKIKGELGENAREFNLGRLDLDIKDKKIILGNKISTKTEKKMMNTITAHIKNMIRGVQEKFEYTLKICHSHFPFTVKMDGNKIIIKNFLGEKVDRLGTVPEGVNVEIKKEIITVSGINKELVGQGAANFEAITKIRGRDTRIFQDGVYIINKCGRKI